MYEGLKDLNPMRHGEKIRCFGTMGTHGDPGKLYITYGYLWLFVMDMKYMDMKYVETCWRMLGDLVLGRILDATKHLQTWSVVQDHQKPANVRKPRLESIELHSRQDLFIITYNYYI